MKENDLMTERKDAVYRDYWLTVGKAYLKCQRVMNQRLAELDISIAQHEILLTIEQNEQISQKELSEKLFAIKSNVSNLLKKLESSGLVRRVQADDDHRRKHLSLTQQGQRVVKKSVKVQQRVIAALMQGSKKAELEVADKVMRQAIAGLDSLA